MRSIIDLFATKEVIIVLVILGVILFAYFILWFVEFMKKHEEKKKLQNNTMELNKLVLQEAIKKQQEEILPVDTTINEVETKEEVLQDEIVEEIKEVPEVVTLNGFTTPIEVEPVVVSLEDKEVVSNDTILLNDTFEEQVEIVEPVKIEVADPEIKNEEEVIKYKDEVYTQTEAQQELERLTQELRKLEEENEDKSSDAITKYESEQEENAIISLDELLAKGKEMTLENEVTQYMDDGNEPISISELEERYKNSIENVVEIEPVVDAVVKEEVVEVVKEKVDIDYFLNNNSVTTSSNVAYQGNTSYKASPVISPIFGIEEENIAKPTALELENTADYEKLDEEIKKTNEFLAKLRELQQKLD